MIYASKGVGWIPKIPDSPLLYGNFLKAVITTIIAVTATIVSELVRINSSIVLQTSRLDFYPLASTNIIKQLKL